MKPRRCETCRHWHKVKHSAGVCKEATRYDATEDITNKNYNCIKHKSNERSKVQNRR